MNKKASATSSYRYRCLFKISLSGRFFFKSDFRQLHFSLCTFHADMILIPCAQVDSFIFPKLLIRFDRNVRTPTIAGYPDRSWLLTFQGCPDYAQNHTGLSFLQYIKQSESTEDSGQSEFCKHQNNRYNLCAGIPPQSMQILLINVQLCSTNRPAGCQFSGRSFVILRRLIAKVDALCSSAVVVDGKTPNAPITIKKELKERIVL